MSDTPPKSDERPEPRSIAEIFADLRSLAQADGSLHCISAIIQRDWFLHVDMQEATIAGDPAERWSLNKLNTNELMLLLGLAVQSSTDRTWTVLPTSREFLTKADHLLREFHDATMEPMRLNWATEGPSKIGLNDIAREAIYYGADSFFMSQFEKYARYRYKDDSEWLVRHAHISIRPMLEIARFIANRINLQMTFVLNTRGTKDVSGRPTLNNELDFTTLTGMLTIPKTTITKQFGQKAEAFLVKFATKAVGQNTAFDNPFAVNQVNSAPLIDLGDFIYVPSQYRLFAAIYESPFYWTMGDLKYRDTASGNRGKFVERSASAIFRRIFGDEFVHDNVIIKSGKDIVAEADVLVSYGEFLIVVQAKSKRITIKARAGDKEALKTDFKGAIQDPYQQAYKFGQLVEAGEQCVGKNGLTIELPNVKRVFSFVLLSDNFPGMTFLSRNMLERRAGVAPVIWDMAILDTIAEILPTPVDFLFFLKCRSDVFDTILSDSEYNYLGYHLKLKLAKPPDCDFMQIDRDFAEAIDDYMVTKEAGAMPDRPLGILDTIEIPIFSDLFKQLKTAPPDLIGIIIELYDFSSASLERLGTQIMEDRAEVEKGKAFRSLSIPTPSGGVTYVIAQNNDQRTREAARSIAHKYKYDTKSDRWYVIINDIKTARAADVVLRILRKWSEDENLADNSKFVSEVYKSSFRDLRS